MQFSIFPTTLLTKSSCPVVEHCLTPSFLDFFVTPKFNGKFESLKFFMKGFSMPAEKAVFLTAKDMMRKMKEKISYPKPEVKKSHIFITGSLTLGDFRTKSILQAGGASLSIHTHALNQRWI